MFNAARLLTGTPALGLLLVLAGCGQEVVLDAFSGGYDKIAYREQEWLPVPAAPQPPPYNPALAAGGAAAVPTLDPATAPPGVTQEMVEAGQQAFGTVCVACHGGAGVGSPAGPALADAEWLNVTGSYDEIVEVIHVGVPVPSQYPAAMPPMGGGSFTEEEVRELAAYVYALSQGQ